MPERDYSKGQIYTIRCRDDPELIYVGSTINTLPRRLHSHKSLCKKRPDILVYKTIAGNWDRFYMELYELYPCGSKNELERREGEITREIGTMNNNIAGRTHKEYYQDNKEAIIDKVQQYTQQNKEQRKEKRKEILHKHYEKNKEKKAEYHRLHFQQNKDKFNERQRAYRARKKAEKEQQQ